MLRLFKILIKLCVVSVIFSGTCFAYTPQNFNFTPVQSALFNVTFAIGAFSILLGLFVAKRCMSRPHYYKKGYAVCLIIGGSLMLSLATVAVFFSKSILVVTPLNLSSIAINSQLASLNTNSNSGIYSVFPPSTLWFIMGVIMFLGWYSIIKGIFHFTQLGKSRGQFYKFMSHEIAGTIALNILSVGPVILNHFMHFH